MSDKLASLWVEILGDARPLHRTLAGAQRALLGFGSIGKRAGGAVARGIGSGMSSVAGAFGSLAGRAARILGGGMLAAGGAAGYGLMKSIQGGSSLAETANKVEVAFDDSAGAVTSASAQMARDFGTPKREFMDGAAQIGLIAQGMGMAKKESAGFAVSTAKLAQDLTSIQNISVPEALEKIRAGLIGEYEPLQSVGVTLSEEKVKAEAAALGLARHGKELSDNAKLAARTSLIQKYLAYATGDLANTQYGAANQSRKFWGQLENLGDSIGTMLLPAFTELLITTNGTLSGMAASLDSGRGVFAGFVSAVSDGIETVTFVWRNFGDIASLAGIGLGEAMINVVDRVEWLGQAFGAFLSWFAANWTTIIPDALAATLVAFDNFKDNAKSFIKEVFDYIASGFQDPIEFKFKPLLEGFNAQSSALELPELKLTSLDEQRKPFLDAIAAREAKASEAKKLSAQANKAAKAGAVAPAESADKGKKSETTDLAGFAKALQAGVLGKGSSIDRVAKATEKMATILERDAKKKPPEPGPGWAVGPA